MSVSEYIAGYAALVGTISLGWNIFNAKTDRGALRIDPELSEKELCILLHITNKGRRNITLSKVVVVNKTSTTELHHDHRFSFGSIGGGMTRCELPFNGYWTTTNTSIDILEPTRSEMVIIRQEQIIQDDFEKIVVIDSCGGEWTISKRKLNDIRNKIIQSVDNSLSTKDGI